MPAEKQTQLARVVGVLLGVRVPLAEFLRRGWVLSGLPVLRRDLIGDSEPGRHAVVAAVLLDDGPRVEGLPGLFVSAKEAGYSLTLRSGVRSELAVEVDESAELVRMHHGGHQRTRPTRRPANPSPIGRIGARTELRDDKGHDVFDQMIGGVTTRTVHAFGVIAETARGVR